MNEQEIEQAQDPNEQTEYEQYLEGCRMELAEMVLDKYPEAKFRQTTLDEIPEGKYFKVAYVAIGDEVEEYIVRGFYIAAIDNATKKDCVIYRSNDR